MENISMDEQRLLSSLQRGEITAFDHIFKKYYPMLCAYGRRFVEYEDAKEIAGDAILWLWEHRQTLLIDTSLSRYLLKSVYRRSLNCIKQKQLKNSADTIFYEEMESVIQSVDAYQVMEISKRIKEAINELPDTYRETFIQHRFTKMSHKEIAEKLGVSPKTVAYRIQQATKLLRKSLSDLHPMILAFLTGGISYLN
ncbi:RNA polymerase sigma-70 factor [Bacteroides sp. GM023]|uniref:RNA polymerase sigma-70 factor n=2 Tax=unclassified Bacteroides TaxID=2646097 RepID=UPI00168A8E01|nr:RNA polymerase sigma-70 factor [Bacteroides sp. GM023]MBD3588017.1 RNA polymerase sigma-70 factor [Bacteroides sp. GM023]